MYGNQLSDDRETGAFCLFARDMGTKNSQLKHAQFTERALTLSAYLLSFNRLSIDAQFNVNENLLTTKILIDDRLSHKSTGEAEALRAKKHVSSYRVLFECFKEAKQVLRG